MCGIFGLVTSKENAIKKALTGVSGLDHRGDDSCGIAYMTENGIFRHVGSKELFNDPNRATTVDDIIITEVEKNQKCNIAITHTRWATIGAATNVNSHPHYDENENFYVVHNGNVENLRVIKKLLKKKKYYSETDTEVIANLIAMHYEKTNDTVTAIQKTMNDLAGSNVILVMCKHEPNKLFTAKKGGTIILGKNTNSIFVASDRMAFGELGIDTIYPLKHSEVAVITEKGWDIIKKTEIEYQDDDYCAKPSKAGHKHFMLKEVLEQDWRLKASLSGRFDIEQGISRLGGINEIDTRLLRTVKMFHFIGCGTAYNSCQYATLILNRFGIAARAWIASEFVDCHPVFNPTDAFIFVSQSGETHDTMEAVREIIIKGNPRIGIINVPDSLIWENMDCGIGIRAGQEKGVASTKAYTLQLNAIVLLSIFLARQRNMTMDTGKKIYKELESLPDKISIILKQKKYIKELAKKYSSYKNCFFLGRYFNYVTAEESSLKLKETSYIHAEAYPLGEMKHGPLALIDKDFLSIVIAPNDTVFDKSLVNIQEIKGRQGPILAITDEESVIELADDTIYVPKTLDFLSPVLYSIPLQLFSYYMALELGHNPDKPRNIAKVVTVG